jgi:hypothetical protein
MPGQRRTRRLQPARPPAVILLLKLLLAPALVVGSSLAGRRWGPRVSGMLAALPIVAGPILLITCLEHGTRFGARAASAALLGLISLALFVLAFAWAARSWNWSTALPISWAVCLLADLALSRLTVTPGWGLALVLASAWTVTKLLPRGSTGPAATPTTVSWPWWDLPARAVATALLVTTLSAISGTVGPSMTGVLAPFPIATSVLAAFILAQRGAGDAVRLLRGVPRGLYGFAAFCFLVAALVERVGIGIGFTLAAAATLSVQLLAAVPARWTARAAQRRHGQEGTHVDEPRESMRPRPAGRKPSDPATRSRMSPSSQP